MSANPLMGFLAWTFIPGYATRFLHSVYYGITIRAGEPRPAPGSPQFRKDFQRIYSVLVLFYLGYTLLQVFHDLRLASDYYTALGVSHWVDEKTLRSRMRRLAAQYHPDKVGSTGPAHDYYVQLQIASEVLLDQVRRFVYDRFGPDLILRASNSLTKDIQLRDWMNIALLQSAPGYAGSFVFLVVLGMTGYMPHGRFWRYLAFISLVVLEVWVVSRPYTPWILYQFINPFLVNYCRYPPLLPFQFLALARKVVFNLFIAISQLGPIFQADQNGPTDTGKEVELQQLAVLEQTVNKSEMEAGQLLRMNLAPFTGDEAAQRELKIQIKDLLVQNTIRAEPEVRRRIAAAVERKQAS